MTGLGRATERTRWLMPSVLPIRIRSGPAAPLLRSRQPAVAGDVIKQPELGKTLRAIAKNGRDAFYKGAIAEDMVETLRGIGGLHSLDDFEGHTTETTAPIGTPGTIGGGKTKGRRRQSGGVKPHR